MKGIKSVDMSRMSYVREDRSDSMDETSPNTLKNISEDSFQGNINLTLVFSNKNRNKPSSSLDCIDDSSEVTSTQDFEELVKDESTNLNPLSEEFTFVSESMCYLCFFSN